VVVAEYKAVDAAASAVVVITVTVTTIKESWRKF